MTAVRRAALARQLRINAELSWQVRVHRLFARRKLTSARLSKRKLLHSDPACAADSHGRGLVGRFGPLCLLLILAAVAEPAAQRIRCATSAQPAAGPQSGIAFSGDLYGEICTITVQAHSRVRPAPATIFSERSSPTANRSRS